MPSQLSQYRGNIERFRASSNKVTVGILLFVPYIQYRVEDK